MVIWREVFIFGGMWVLFELSFKLSYSINAYILMNIFLGFNILKYNNFFGIFNFKR